MNGENGITWAGSLLTDRQCRSLPAVFKANRVRKEILDNHYRKQKNGFFSSNYCVIISKQNGENGITWAVDLVILV